MNELELIIDLHLRQDRQGPGSGEESLRALEMTGLLRKEDLEVADIGCGTGEQSLFLAKHLDGHIRSVDLFPAFLEKLNERAMEKGLSEKINTVEASMEDLPFAEESLDLIWSEGAIYNMGFENGIHSWNKFLKPGGYMALSEITWISSTRPQEIENFWNENYPEISLASKKIEQIEANGFTLVGYFYLKPESWLENYYAPLEEAFEAFLHRNNGSELAKQVIEEHRAEIQLFKDFQDHFSYGFYVMKKE